MSSLAVRAVRRLVLATAAIAVVVPVTLSSPASAATQAPPGIFGTSDPTYDGVFRQSVALIGLRAAQTPIPPTALAWLVGQQCASGAFEAFRADPTTPCSIPDPVAFSGPDSNSTALAAMALQGLGQTAPAARAVAALISAQNADGGWGYTLGSPSDVNSTGLSLAALKSQPAKVGARAAIKRATSYLAKAAYPCSAKPAQRFGLPYQPGQTVNALATAQALIGIAGTLPFDHIAATSVAGATCRRPLVERVSSYLDRLIRATNGRIPSALDRKQVDWNTTAAAVVGLTGAGAAPEAIRTAIDSLGAHTVDYVKTGTDVSPAAAGTLIQAAVGAGVNPRAFGDARTNVVALLLRTLQR